MNSSPELSNTNSSENGAKKKSDKSFLLKSEANS